MKTEATRIAMGGRTGTNRKGAVLATTYDGVRILRQRKPDSFTVIELRKALKAEKLRGASKEGAAGHGRTSRKPGRKSA